jgi:hypothetical protein
MKIYCVKCYTTHDDSLPCFDKTAQAAKDMGIKLKNEPPSPEQARLDQRALMKAVILVVLAALLLLVGGAFLFSD